MQRIFPGLAAALAVLAGAGPGQCQLTTLRIPGDIEWKQAQQLPFNPGGFFESVDFKIEDGIAPLDTARWVPLPAIPDSIVSVSDFGFADRQLFDAFTRHVSRDRVLAQTGVVEDGAVIVEAGGLLLSPKEDFPRTVAGVRLFRAAGIDSLRAMVNLANAVLVPIDPQLRFSNWLRSPTIYETQLTKGQEQALLEALIDADPDNSFRRVDGQNRPVRKRSVVIIMDLTRRFPIGMVRFYPRVEENPLPIAGYKLEVHDGVTVKRGKGERIAERDFLGFGGGAEASAGTVPVFEQLIIDQSNTADTVAVRFDDPEYLQQFKFRSLTGLDFDIAEFEVFNEGFTPKAVYLGKPLPVDPAGIDAMLRYLGGDLSLRAELDQLQGGTLGRVSWDEEKTGDPSASAAVVSMQTGFTPEPWIPIRLNRNGDAVEWRPEAEVVDRRAGSPGHGGIVNLDDPLLRAGARDIWNALSDEERLVARTTFPEYNDPAIVPVANKRTRAGEMLPILPDPLFWSGFQPLRNGERAQLPGERPFFQLRVDFTSSDPGAATVIRNLRIEQLLPPLLREVRAEIVPATEVTAGRDTLFTYALRPRFRPADPGFNRIRIPTPTRISRVQSVRFAYGLDGVERAEEVAFETVASEEDLFVLGIPRVEPSISAGDSLVVLVDFRARVLDVKTDFTGHVFLDTLGAAEGTDYGGIITLVDGDGDGADTLATLLPQRVMAGDVLAFPGDLSDRNSLAVVTSVAQPVEEVISRVGIAPNPFTPNGDGINDSAAITFDVLRVVESVPVTTELFDLSGRLVRKWEAERTVGSFSETWDGSGDDGRLVPPGLYLLKLKSATDSGAFGATLTVSVVY